MLNIKSTRLSDECNKAIIEAQESSLENAAMKAQLKHMAMGMEEKEKENEELREQLRCTQSAQVAVNEVRRALKRQVKALESTLLKEKSVLKEVQEDLKTFQDINGQLEETVMGLKAELEGSVMREKGLGVELKKQREVLLYINKISAENEALRRKSLGLQPPSSS